MTGRQRFESPGPVEKNRRFENTRSSFEHSKRGELEQHSRGFYLRLAGTGRGRGTALRQFDSRGDRK